MDEDKCMRAKLCRGVVQGKLQCLVWEDSPKEREEECSVLWLERAEMGAEARGRTEGSCCAAGRELGLIWTKSGQKKVKQVGFLFSNTC